jgi:hypothetical protein
VPERIKITVRPSGSHPDVLTIEDAMQQVLDVFEMIDKMPGVEWKLVNASTNSPLQVEAEAVSFEPSVDVTVVARAQKQQLARNLRQITRGEPPVDPDFKVHVARKIMARNLNGVGTTEIELDSEPITVTPRVAKSALDVLANKPPTLFDIVGARDEIGSVEGTLSDVGTHYNVPAAKILDTRTKKEVWCRLSDSLQGELQDKATYKDVWEHRRVLVSGRVKFDKNGDILYVVATDMRRIEPREVSLDALRDPDFTGGLPIGEYLDRFRDGTLG